MFIEVAVTLSNEFTYLQITVVFPLHTLRVMTWNSGMGFASFVTIGKWEFNDSQPT